MKNKHPFIESTIFMILMTTLGGFLNTYAFMNRGGFFTNGQTGNTSALGVSIGLMQWFDAIIALFPIVLCLLGTIVCEFVREKSKGIFWFSDKWYKRALLLEGIFLLIVGFIPTSVPHFYLDTLMAFITGFQINIFRVWKGNVHNTTIATGNYRALGATIYKGLTKKAGFRTIASHSVLVLAFAFGSLLSALTSVQIGYTSVWIGTFMVALALILIYFNEKNQLRESD